MQSNPQIPWAHVNSFKLNLSTAGNPFNWDNMERRSSFLLATAIWFCYEILFSMNFITFCLYIFKSNDIILFLPYPDLSPQPCLQLSRFIPLQRWPRLAGPHPSSPRLFITSDLSSSLSRALKLPLGFTLTLTLPTYPLPLMTDGVMQAPRTSEEDRRGTRSRRDW